MNKQKEAEAKQNVSVDSRPSRTNKKSSFGGIVGRGFLALLTLSGPLSLLFNRNVQAKEPKDCVDFWHAANIDYTPVVWDPVDKAFESIFRQRSAANQTGYVEDVEYGGDMYERGLSDPLVTFPIGARIVGYHGDTKKTVIKLPDGTTLDSYTTTYCGE